MDTSGYIRDLIEDNEQLKPNEILITQQQASRLRKVSTNKRKVWMRNKPCVCGSGRKFKKCCWSKFSRKAQTVTK